MKIVVLAGDDLIATASVLNGIAAQVRQRSQAEIIVVSKRRKRSGNRSMTVPAKWQGIDIRFVAPGELAEMLGANAEGQPASLDDFVVVTTDDHHLPPDWLTWLDAHIANSPEVDFFYSESSYFPKASPGALERAAQRGGLQPRPVTGPRGLVWAPFGNWACRTAALARCGGWPLDESSFDNAWNLSYRLLRAGARTQNAKEWQSAYQPDSQLRPLLARAFREGYLAGQHVVGARDDEGADRIFIGGRSLLGAWRRSVQLAARGWQTSANEGSLIERGLGAAVAFAFGCTRESGLLIGAHRTEPALGARLSAQADALYERRPDTV